MKTQIVYSLIASKDDLYLQELWASVYSLRHYEPYRDVRVCCDEPTSTYIRSHVSLLELLTEIVVVPTPSNYSQELKSRHVKTLIRDYINGPFLYIDTDTIICSSLDEIDEINCDIGGVADGNISFDANPFRQSILLLVKRAFDVDASQHSHWINGGVIYAADSKKARDFYQKWHKNWMYSALKKNIDRDMPALLKTEMDTNIVIKELSGYLNAQPYMSVTFFGEAKILHFLHSFFPEDQSFCPFFDKIVYRRIRLDAGISQETAETILHVKSSITSPSMIVGERTFKFMTSPSEPIFEKIYEEGGIASWLMQKIANFLWWLHKLTKKR